MVCSSRKKPLELVKGNNTTSELPEMNGTCVTVCHVAERRFVVDFKCQSVKLLGHENRKLAGDASDMESVGAAACAPHAISSTKRAR